METSTAFAFGVLCCYCWCPPPSGNAFPAQGPLRLRDSEAIDPSVDTQAAAAAAAAAAATAADNDRDKRQLSSVQSRLLNFLKPLPIVDVTREEEKYGNDGDKFNRFGRSFIGGVETVSTVVTSALSFPLDTAKRLSRTATEMLNNLGGRIVGLQR